MRTASIEFSEDEKTSTKTTVGVQGAVTHAHDGDRVRILLDDAAGNRLVEETRTDDNGVFEAALDLNALGKMAGRDAGDVAGTYAAQAETFAADTVAEAHSNVITIVR